MSRVRVLLTVPLALAVALASGVVYAHTIEFPTSLSIARSPKGTLPKGTLVTFSGRVSSEKHRCVVNSRVGVALGPSEEILKVRSTDDRGRYSITIDVEYTSTWRTKFLGKVLNATSPHNHTCADSASRKIRVPVG